MLWQALAKLPRLKNFVSEHVDVAYSADTDTECIPYALFSAGFLTEYLENDISGPCNRSNGEYHFSWLRNPKYGKC